LENSEVKIPSDKVKSITLASPRLPFWQKFNSIKLLLTFLYEGLFIYLLKDESIGEVSFVSLTTIIVASYFGAQTAGKFVKR